MSYRKWQYYPAKLYKVDQIALILIEGQIFGASTAFHAIIHVRLTLSSLYIKLDLFRVSTHYCEIGLAQKIGLTQAGPQMFL